MNSADMDTGIIFTWDENAQWHDMQCKRNAVDRQCLNVIVKEFGGLICRPSCLGRMAYFVS